MAFYMDGEIYQILDFQHVKPGKGGAFVRTRLKKVKSGNVFEKTFRSGEKFDPCFLEKRPFQFLFRIGTDLTLMDLESYEQVSVPSEDIGDSAKFLKDECEVQALTADGNVLGYECPNFMELAITEAEPGVKGNSASGGVMKGAVVETGAAVQVPMHIEEGDVVRIDTRNGAYIERVSKG